MKNYQIAVFGKTRRAAILAVCCLPLLAGQASAQQAAATSGNADDTVKMEKFTVTGSYIPFAADAPATPVTVVTSDELAKAGGTGDLLEIIRKTVPQFTGAGNLGSSNGDISSGSTGGGSAVALRNTTTLVLVNGRRAAFNPIVATGGFQFVDVNSIPVSAVERLEIVTDGASATYGSDAVSGVVNIILKTDYQGLEVGGRYQHSYTGEDNWEERSVRLITGAKSGNSALTISAEWLRSDPIFYKDRPFSTPNYGTPTFPGVVQIGGTTSGRYYLLKPGLNAPPLNQDLTEAQLVANGTYVGNPAHGGTAYTLSEITQIFNLAERVTGHIVNEKKALTAAYSHKRSEALEFFGDMLYSKVNTFSQLNAQPITSVGAQTHVASDPRNPFNITVRARNRFVDYPRQYLYDADSIRLVAGLKGRLNEHVNYELAANYNQVDQLYRNKNVLDRNNFTAAIANGTINLFARTQAPGALASANIFGVAYANNQSKLSSFDGRIFGEFPFDMPAGPVSYAVGFEARKETLSSEPDLGSYTDPTGNPVQWDGANPGNPFSRTRTIDSAFVQLRFPLASKQHNSPGIYSADLDIAVRHDKYNDTEDPTVPKVLLRWQPFDDQFAVRASYSKSFNAPTLYFMFGPSLIGNTLEIVNFRGADGHTYESLGQLDARTDANPALKPARSTNYNVGLVWSPKNAKGLKVEVSYFNIQETDVITIPVSQDILQDVELKGANSVYKNMVHFGGFNGPIPTAPGQIVNGQNGLDPTVVLPYVNLLANRQQGVDLTVKYTQNLEGMGRIDYGLSGLWWKSFTIDGQETVGMATIVNGTLPKFLWYGTADWSKDNWSIGASVQYIGKVDETLDYQEVLSKVPAFTAVDFRGSYTFKDNGPLKWLNGLKVQVGVNNAFEKMPPVAGNVFSNANADIATYFTGLTGRVFYIDATYKF